MNINNLTKDELITIVHSLSTENAYLKLSFHNNLEDINFSDYIEKWLLKNKYRWQETTYENYTNIISNHIAPYFRERNMECQQFVGQFL